MSNNADVFIAACSYLCNFMIYLRMMKNLKRIKRPRRFWANDRGMSDKLVDI